MKLNCYSNMFNPTVLISHNEIGSNCKLMGFSLSINPVTQTPEILCCASSEISYLLRLIAINPLLSYEFIDISSIESFSGVGYAEYCQFNNTVYLWGQQASPPGPYQSLKIIDRTTLSLYSEYNNEQFTSSFFFDRPIINQENGDVLLTLKETNPAIAKMFVVKNTDYGYQTWEVPKLVEDFYTFGSAKWFINDTSSAQFFWIPSSDGTLIIMHPSPNGYTSSFISTGKEYMRTKISSNGSYIYGWYPNVVNDDHNPLFITNTFTGSTTTIHLKYPFRSFGIDENTSTLFVPQMNSSYHYNINKYSAFNGTYLGEIPIDAPSGIFEVYSIENHLWYIYGTGEDCRIGLYDISTASVINTYDLNLNWDAYNIPINFEFNEDLNYFIVSFGTMSANNFFVFNATTGALIDSQHLDGCVVKSICGSGGYCYLLARQESFSSDKIYKYQLNSHTLSIVLNQSRIPDIVYSSTNNCLYILINYFIDGVNNSRVKSYNCSTEICTDMSGVPCVSTNIAYRKSTNRLYVYSPYVSTGEDEGNIAITCYDLDNNTAGDPTVNLTGLSYLVEPQPNIVFAWTDILIHPETGDLLFVPQRHSTLVSFQDEIDSRKLVAGAWRWLSFPQLDREANNSVDGPLLFEPVTGVGGIGSLQLRKGYNFVSNFTSLTGWVPDAFSIKSTECTKVYFTTPNQAILPITGTILDPHDAAACFDLISLDLSGTDFHENWIGYWLLDNQNPRDVFGANWDKVEGIYAEDWYYRRLVDPRNGTPIAVPSSKTRPFEYGEGYIIKVNQDIPGFRWGVTGINLPSFERKEVQNFTYESKPEYEVIDVLDIPSDVTEIGVFDGNTCIGAVAVQDSCEQILVYPDSENTGEPYQFQVVSGRSVVTINNYHVYRDAEATFLAGVFGKSESYSYHCVKLGDRGEEQSIVPAVLSIHGNYPNPFNLQTRIAYYLPSKTNVEVSIYNIKGQLVKSFNRGAEEMGDHFVNWDGNDSFNRECASGIYFCRVVAGSRTKIHKMLLVK